MIHIRNHLTGAAICSQTGALTDEPTESDCIVCKENAGMDDSAGPLRNLPQGVSLGETETLPGELEEATTTKE